MRYCGIDLEEAKNSTVAKAMHLHSFSFDNMHVILVDLNWLQEDKTFFYFKNYSIFRKIFLIRQLSS